MFFGAPVLVVVGIILLVNSFRPFKMRIDERGILLDTPPTRCGSRWAGSTSRKSRSRNCPSRRGGGHRDLPGGVAAGRRELRCAADRMIQRNGWTGYRLIDVDDVREGKEKLTAALAQYAAPIFR
ncbi:hypothetical protein [Saccharopolyspora sp. NPDC002376]